MKTNQKQLRLIQHGLRPSTVTNLSESQVNSLYRRLTESKSKNVVAVVIKKLVLVAPIVKNVIVVDKKKKLKKTLMKK